MSKIVLFPGNNALIDKNRLGYFLPSTLTLERTARRANRRIILSKNSTIGSPEVTIFTRECRMESRMRMGIGVAPSRILLELYYSQLTKPFHVFQLPLLNLSGAHTQLKPMLPLIRAGNRCVPNHCWHIEIQYGENIPVSTRNMFWYNVFKKIHFLSDIPG